MGKHLPIEICALIEEHVKEHGVCSHLAPLWNNEVRKRWKRNDLIELCLYKLDFTGGKLMGWCTDIAVRRSKIKLYMLSKYPEAMGTTADK